MSIANIYNLYKYVNNELRLITIEIENIKKIKTEYKNRVGNNISIYHVDKLIERMNNKKNIDYKILFTLSKKKLNNNLEIIINNNLPEIWVIILEAKTLLENMLTDRECIILPIFVSRIIGDYKNIVKPIAIK